ncbi:MAG TPA: tetratricopeptide repeat protein [Candidatus Acidoferrales bacterium]|nr:tetratricopeptide repeat protein [Candidatus Acidoferrales bacterium]
MAKNLSAALLSVLLGTLGAQTSGAAQAPVTAPANQTPTAVSPDAKHAQAMYYFTLGHLQELQFEREYQASGKIDSSSDAIDSYKKALELEPNSPVIMERLAEVDAESQRIGDAVTQAQAVLKLDPNNLAAHRLLARIYVRTLGEMNDSATQSANVQKAVAELQAILKLAPDDSESALWLARLYRAENKPEDAEKLLRNILAKQPDDGEALEQMSQLLIDEGRSQEAVSLLSDAADQFSSPDLYDLLGDAYSQDKQYSKAEDAYKKAVAMDPDDPGHRHGLADTLLTENKYTEALEQYKKLSQMEPGTAENYLRMSQLYKQLGQFSDAEASLMRAKQLAPGNLEVLDNEALLYEAQGRYDDAIKVLSDAIAGLKNSSAASNPSAMAILYRQLGDDYRHSKNYPAALQAYADMGKLGDTAQKEAELLTIETYQDSRDLDKAIAEAKKALVASPNDPDITGSLAMLYADKGDAAAGAKLLEPMLHGNNGDSQVYLQIAQVQAQGKKYTEAEQSAQKAQDLAQRPEQKQSAWFMLGDIYNRQKKYDEAGAEFQKILDANPGSTSPMAVQTLNYYGYMLADRGVRLDEAQSMIQKAVDQDPNSYAYLDSLGWVYYKQGKYTQAEDYLRRAIALEGDDPTVLSHLGDVYLKLGQNQQAEDALTKSAAQWHNVLPADYEPDKANAVDAQLKALKKHLGQKSSTETGKQQ